MIKKVEIDGDNKPMILLKLLLSLQQFSLHKDILPIGVIGSTRPFEGHGSESYSESGTLTYVRKCVIKWYNKQKYHFS